MSTPEHIYIPFGFAIEDAYPIILSDGPCADDDTIYTRTDHAEALTLAAVKLALEKAARAADATPEYGEHLTSSRETLESPSNLSISLLATVRPSAKRCS